MKKLSKKNGIVSLIIIAIPFILIFCHKGCTFLTKMNYSWKIKSEIKSKISKLDSSITNIIFIYDAPKASGNCHAHVMTNIIKSFFLDINKSTILHVPYKYVDPEEFEEFVKPLQKNKKIYINLSTHPKIDGEIETYVDVMKKLSVNAVISIATGNTYKLILKSESNQTKILKIDNDIWKELNKTIYPELIYDKTIYPELTYDRTIYPELIYFKVNNSKYLFSEELKDFVENNVTNILKKYNISADETIDIHKHYQETIHTYFLIHYLQALDTNITFVSAHTPFSKEQVIKNGYVQSYQKYKDINISIPKKEVANYDNNYSLDCRIDGLVDYGKTTRSFGQYPHTNNGTSQAAPAVLAEKVLESIKKEKDNK